MPEPVCEQTLLGTVKRCNQRSSVPELLDSGITTADRVPVMTTEESQLGLKESSFYREKLVIASFKVNQLETVVAQLKMENTSLQSHIQQTEAEKELLDLPLSENNFQEDKLVIANLKLQQLQTAMAQMERENTNLKSQLQQKHNECEIMRRGKRLTEAQVARLEEQNLKLKDEVNTLEERNYTLKSLLDSTAVRLLDDETHGREESIPYVPESTTKHFESTGVLHTTYFLSR